MWPLSITIIVTLLITSILANHYQTTDDKQEKINLRKLVTEINSDPKSLWKADTYGFDEIHASDVKQKLGLKLRREDKSPSQKPLKLKASIRNEPKLGAGTALPKFYDARQRYPNCSSISHIRDQSYCGSCWAVSGASVFSDRLCIHSKGKYTGELSSRFILSCDKDNYGCNGGYLDTMWDFLGVYGTVTGGEFQSDEGCQPYPLHPCGWPRKLACPWYLTPKCIKNKCDNEMYQYPREPRNYKVKESYSVGDPFGIFSEIMIQDEIYQNGPVQAGFYVYADFMTYKSGIYHRTRRSRFLGGHAVKIIGWGVEKGVKYWLIANSWGEEWGEKGTFRMLRGEDECGIEDEVYAGIPNI